MTGAGAAARKPLAARVAGIALRAPKRTLLAVGVVVVAAVPLALNAFDSLDPYEFKDPGSDSAEASAALERVTGIRADGSIIALIDAPARTDPGRERIEEVGADLLALPGIKRVLTPYAPEEFFKGTGDRRTKMIGTGGESAYVVAEVDASADGGEIADAIEDHFGEDENVEFGGVVIAEDQIAEQSETDLQRAEMIAFPLLLVLSLLFFRSLVAAALPLVLGAIAIVGSLAVMRALHEVEPLSVLAINVVTGLGLGLAIDYSLFIVSRYREELAQGVSAPEALRRTVLTSGRAVAFSGVTVACAMASLLVFPQQFLYSVAISGIAVALLCALGALIVLPAILALLGERVNALAPGWLQRSARTTALPDSQGRWYRFTHWVMRHPASIALLATALLVAMAIPAARMNFVPEDASLLPADQSAGAVDRRLAEDFKPDPQYPIITQWISADPDAPPPPWVPQYREDARELEGVVAVPKPALVGENVVRMDVFTDVGRATPRERELVDEVRALESPVEAEVRVGGLTASQIDEEASVTDHLPLAVAILLITTYCALFVMTASLVLPLKALLMNIVTLAATMGLLVLVFQDGNLQDVLGFSDQGGILISITAVIVVAGFGLSTDYGVFSLSRIRELHDSGEPNEEAVALGLERTGRLITSAALLFAVAMGALVTGSLIGVKETGFGLAAAVLMDALIVRSLLVPSLMVMLGDRNWLAPRVLKGSRRTQSIKW